MGIAADEQGNFYIADGDNQMVMKVSPDGILRVVAGNGIYGYSGEGGPATDASLFFPGSLCLDQAGNLYIAEAGGRVRKVTPGGIITSIAGDGTFGFGGDGGPATSATIRRPLGIAIDRAGNIYIADTDNHRIRKITPDGIIRTVAGTGRAEFSGDGGPATEASLHTPYGVAVDSLGNVYVADIFNLAIRKITPDGIISTVAGGGFDSGDGIPATSAALLPTGVTVSASGDLYISDAFAKRVVKVTPDGILTTVAGNGIQGFSGDGGPATEASLNSPTGVAVDPAGNVYIADNAISRVRRVTNGIISTAAGNGLFRSSGDGGPATNATMYLPTALTHDSEGGFYIAEPTRHRVRKVGRNGIISVFAGTGEEGYSGDGGPAATAALNYPGGLATDAADNVYIADTLNNNVRKVTRAGIISTVAGSRRPDFSGDGGPATAATLYVPTSVAVDKGGSLYITDTGNERIRKVTPEGIISTLAGTGKAGFAGDGGPATGAALNKPYGIAVDAAGNVYVTDAGNLRVRKIAPDGSISTAAGNGEPGYSGDGGPATSASFGPLLDGADNLYGPTGIAVDPSGTVYIGDESNQRVRVITSDGIISTLAGSGERGLAGDGRTATEATFRNPTALTIDPAGNLLIADWANHRVRALLAAAPTFQLSSERLSFSANSGGLPATARTVGLTSAILGLSFFSETGTASGGDWLRVTPSSGSMPASVQISGDPKDLVPGIYQGTVTITAPNADPPVRRIAVSFEVAPAAPPKLGVKPDNLSLSFVPRSSAITQTVVVSNEGGGALNFTAAATTTSGGAWLSVSTNSGAATPSTPASLTVRANPAGLSPGTYSGRVSIANGSTGEEATVPVTITVSAVQQTMQLTQTGLTFTAVAGGGFTPTQSFGVQNIGQGVMTWSASAETLSGGSSWLSVSPIEGASDASARDVPQIEVSINPAGLAPGDYYGQVQVSAPEADNSPQSLSVVLNVLPAGSNPGPIVRPTGLIFTGVAGGVSPSSQNVFVFNLTDQATSFSSGRLTQDAKEWFVHLPTDATVTPDRGTRIVVQPDVAGLDPGVYRGTLTLLFPGGTTRAVNLLFVVVPNAAGGAKAVHQAQGDCAPSRLLPLFTTLPESFSIPAGWPNQIEVRVVDDCASPMLTGSVVTTFSNGDPPLSLISRKDGRWTGTWQARNAGSSQLTVGVSAEMSELKIKGAVQVTGGLRTSQGSPVIKPGAIVSAASLVPQAPLAPGSLISIFGAQLADAQTTSPGLPLELQLAGTLVAIGGRPIPLVGVSEGRIDAVLPYDLTVNTHQHVVVTRGSAITTPETVTVATAQPAIFTKDQTGAGQGDIRDTNSNLFEPGHPAQAGDTILITCSGLGAVDPPVTAGSDAASRTVLPVSVSIGGVQATVAFAGLAAGKPGVYLVRATIPQSVAGGDAVAVLLNVGGQVSPPVTMAVK